VSGGSAPTGGTTAGASPWALGGLAGLIGLFLLVAVVRRRTVSEPNKAA
jgi:hypothetical protein